MSAPRHLCTGCGIVRTANPLCPGCAMAEYDVESPWDLQPYSPDETIHSGYWRHVRGGVKEWVPLIPEDPEPVFQSGERPCQGCGKTFKPDHGLRRYHSPACRKKAGLLAAKAREQQDKQEAA